MKDLKKYLTMLGIAGIVTAAAAPSQAFTSKGSSTLTAGAAVGGTPTVQINSVALKAVGSNAPVSGLNLGWATATPGAGWLLADQYIEMNTTINTTNGGVQFYTDNVSGAANPKFSGSISTFTATPAGLVDVADTTQKLPTAWRASTGPVVGIASVDPNNAANPEHFLWFFHLDHSQVKVPNLNATTYHDGDTFVTVFASPNTPLTSTGYASAADQTNGIETTTPEPTSSANSGLHFAQGPTQFGGFNANATTDIYIEADFTGALAQTAYSTNRLILEAFRL